ncbi:MAG: hypothetical protein SCH71_14190 [Desulfobulbaceae bacterium]|nr:hypothetical protein [Desulfobulbaceae bacterium]
MMKKITILLFIVSLSWLPAATAAEPIKACQVVTRTEAEKAAGVHVADGRLTEFEEKIMQGTTLCHFESLDAEHYKRFVSIELTVAASDAEAAEKFSDALSLVNAPETVKGIGEEAAWGGAISGPKGGLNIRQGKYYLQIKVSRGDEKKNLQQAEILAKKALPRLP